MRACSTYKNCTRLCTKRTPTVPKLLDGIGKRTYVLHRYGNDIATCNFTATLWRACQNNVAWVECHHTANKR